MKNPLYASLNQFVSRIADGIQQRNNRRGRRSHLSRRQELDALTPHKPLRLRLHHLLRHNPVTIKYKYPRRHDLLVGIHARGRDLARQRQQHVGGTAVEERRQVEERDVGVLVHGCHFRVALLGGGYVGEAVRDLVVGRLGDDAGDFEAGGAADAGEAVVEDFLVDVDGCDFGEGAEGCVFELLGVGSFSLGVWGGGGVDERTLATEAVAVYIGVKGRALIWPRVVRTVRAIRMSCKLRFSQGVDG